MAQKRYDPNIFLLIHILTIIPEKGLEMGKNYSFYDNLKLLRNEKTLYVVKKKHKELVLLCFLTEY